MSKTVHTMSLEKLERRIRNQKWFLCIMATVFAICWLISFVFSHAVDPLIGWMVITTFFGFELIILSLSFLYDNLVLFLRKNMEK